MPRIERSVDLPAPDGPMMEMNSPGCTSKVMRRRTYMRPAGVSNTFSRFRMAIRRVEVSRRLVGEEEERIPRHGARDSDALLLTAGELSRVVLHAVAHA